MARASTNPPQQARSRAAQQRLLTAAEHVLVSDGTEEFTIARVAEEAGVSVGGVYRRFANKDDLIDAVREGLVSRLETAVADALGAPMESLGAVLTAFTSALGGVLIACGRIVPEVLAEGRGARDADRGVQALTTLNQCFVDASAPHRAQITHPDPDLALGVAFRSIVATAVHRAAIAEAWPDELTWPSGLGRSPP